MYTFEIYRDARQEWRWRLRASNGHIVADSAEGYQRRQDLQEVLVHLREGIVQAVEVETA